MELNGCKKSVRQSSQGSGSSKQQCSDVEKFIIFLNFSFFELPFHLICDILSRLSLKDICRCKCVSKRFHEILKDPYFARVHLARAPLCSTNLALQQCGKMVELEFFPIDFRESLSSTCSSDGRIIHSDSCTGYHPSTSFTSFNSDDEKSSCNTSKLIREPNASPEFYLYTSLSFSLIGSCNGLLCLCVDTPLCPTYSICNPLLGEGITLPRLEVSTPSYTYSRLSAFGCCLRSKQYKVVSFLCSSNKMVAKVHTLGSDSWTTIENAPRLMKASIDPFLNGALHWVTSVRRPSELIVSFDLEKEMFKVLPRPDHFTSQYLDDVSWMNSAVLTNCLYICSIYQNCLFEVWVMKEYGVKDSWTKEVSIDMKYYCLQVKDLIRPIKFFTNGDLWFMSSAHSLVSFCPKTKTFKELRPIRSLATDVSQVWLWRSEVTAHDLSFISLKDVVGPKANEVKNMLVKTNWLFLKI